MTAAMATKRQILIVDDHPIVRQGLRRMFEAEPDLAVIDMDHDDSGALLRLLGASRTLKRSTIPALGLTRRGDLKTKLRAFDQGVDDILTMPFSPEELLARSIVITRRALGTISRR